MKRIFILLAVLASLYSFKGDDATDKITLYVDAGHGGQDAGASAATGEKESDLCLQLARVIKQKGEARNVHVILVRTEDEYMELKTHAAEAKDAARNSYLVSLHLSASENSADKGIRLIADKSSQIDGTMFFLRKMMHNFGKLGPMKVENKAITVLHESRIPAVVLAPGFITNEGDLAKIKTRAYQEAVADVLINAVTME